MSSSAAVVDDHSNADESVTADNVSTSDYSTSDEETSNEDKHDTNNNATSSSSEDDVSTRGVQLTLTLVSECERKFTARAHERSYERERRN